MYHSALFISKFMFSTINPFHRHFFFNLFMKSWASFKFNDASQSFHKQIQEKCIIVTLTHFTFFLCMY